ncbi:MAG: DUF1003 domain-containing protein [Sphingomicrobium sp.]
MTNTPAPPPFNPQDATPILPAHMSETISAIAKLHADHEREATPTQRLIEKTTEWLGKPRFLGEFTIFVVGWVGIVGLQTKLYGSSFDPPPFNLLQGVLTVLAVYITALILSTQRRAGQLASHREQLTLELATLAEQKSAKTIAMLEEIRRDNPLLPNRVDKDAEARAETVDPGAVLKSIIETQEELKERKTPNVGTSD